jgi:putative flippase GtrA
MLSFLPWKFLIFCMVGAVSAAIDIALLYFFVERMGLPLLLSASIALFAASINGYILNKLFTFKDSSKRVKTQYLLYLAVSIGGLLLTLALLILLTEFFSLYYLHAKIITIVMVTAWNYILNHYFVFKEQAA